MKIIHENRTEKFKNSENCIAIEYSMGDKDINGAVIKLTGRYPDKGKVVNLKCKELAYIIEGSGRVIFENKKINLKPGDLVLIKPKEKIYWDGNLTMFVTSTPAWYSGQHKEVK